MFRLLKVLLVLAVIALVVDRVADYVAEQAAAGELQRSQGLERKPDVSITGFPFLNQFASGHYEQVIVTADDVRVGAADTSLTLAKVRLDFRGVTASRDFTSFRAESATAHATVGYPALSKTLGIKVGFGGDGRVTASKSSPCSARRFGPRSRSSRAWPRTPSPLPARRSAAAGNLPAGVSAALREIFGVDLSLEDLPFDVKVTAVRVTRTGLDLVLAGKDLSYQPPG